MACCALGCDRPSASPGSRDVGASDAPSLLADDAELRGALAALQASLPQPIRALSLRVLPDRALLQVQDRQRPQLVHQYRYKNGEIMGPINVQLSGAGKLEDNLFPLKYADLNAIPKLVRQAEQRAVSDGAMAKSVTLKRNLPASMDIQFQVSVTAPGGNRRVDARKDGKIFRVQPEL